MKEYLVCEWVATYRTLLACWYGIQYTGLGWCLDSKIASVLGWDIADRVLCIPLSRIAHDDFLVWGAEPLGEFTVHTGYRLFTSSGYTGIPDSYRIFYTTLWKLDLPAKVKITVWRVFNNYILSYYNLYNKILRASALCPRCLISIETLEHIFRNCLSTSDIWRPWSSNRCRAVGASRCTLC